MSGRDGQPVFVGTWGRYLLWTDESLPQDTTVVRRDNLIAPTSAALCEILLTEKGVASVLSTLNVMQLPWPRFMEYESQGVRFTPLLRPASSAPN